MLSIEGAHSTRCVSGAGTGGDSYMLSFQKSYRKPFGQLMPRLSPIMLHVIYHPITIHSLLATEQIGDSLDYTSRLTMVYARYECQYTCSVADVLHTRHSADAFHMPPPQSELHMRHHQHAVLHARLLYSHSLPLKLDPKQRGCLHSPCSCADTWRHPAYRLA